LEWSYYKVGRHMRHSNVVSFFVFIDCVAGEIIRLVASVCVSVRLSVGALLFEPFDLGFWHEG